MPDALVKQPKLIRLEIYSTGSNIPQSIPKTQVAFPQLMKMKPILPFLHNISKVLNSWGFLKFGNCVHIVTAATLFRCAYPRYQVFTVIPTVFLAFQSQMRWTSEENFRNLICHLTPSFCLHESSQNHLVTLGHVLLSMLMTGWYILQ